MDVGVSALRLGRSEIGVRVLDVAQELAEQVQRVHADITKRVAAIAALRWQRATAIRRVVRAAEIVDGDDLADRAAPDESDRPGGERIAEQRVVHAEPQAGGRRLLRQAVAILDARRQRLLDEHMAAQPQRFQRHRRVAVRWGQHMDDVQARGGHRLERLEGRQARGTRPGEVEVGHPDDANVGQPSQRFDVKLADVARAHQSDSVRRHVGRAVL